MPVNAAPVFLAPMYDPADIASAARCARACARQWHCTMYVYRLNPDTWHVDSVRPVAAHLAISPYFGTVYRRAEP